MRKFTTLWLWVGMVVGQVACTAVGGPNPPVATPVAPPVTTAHQVTPTLQPSLLPTLTPTLSLSHTATPLPDSGWQAVRPGLERRIIRLLDENGRWQEQLYLLRLEPELYRFTVAYRPGEPQTLAAWQAETGALLVVNGGYFTEEWLATGRIVVEGVGTGTSYQGFGGMLAVTDGGVEVRSLAERPYDPAEPLQYALQSFPVLVKAGGESGFPEEDGVRGRRTVVAMDDNGRLLFLLAPNGSFTLYELSRYLLESDLEIAVALNLDGGTSTGLILADPAEAIPAFVPLPAVIAVYPLDE